MLPVDSAVVLTVLTGREWGQISFAVVGLGPVLVMDMLTLRKPGEKSVFVALNVLPSTDLPSQQDVAMLTDIATRLGRWYLIEIGDRSDAAPTSARSAARRTKPVLLDRNKGRVATATANDGSHVDQSTPVVITIKWSCCSHFSTPENLDKHKTSAGKCKDPARLKKQDGTPVLMEVQRKSGSVWVGWQESLSTFGVSPANEEEVA